MHARAPRPPARDSGFSLVEIIVVVAILAILMAALVTQLRGSKQATYLKSGASVATTYMDAVEAYMADNGRTPPEIGGEDWPDDAASLHRGPVNRLLVDAAGDPRRYLKTVPEQVTSGLVAFGGAGVDAGQAQVRVEYVVTGQSYAFLVKPVDGSLPGCYLTNAGAAPAGATGMGPC